MDALDFELGAIRDLVPDQTVDLDGTAGYYLLLHVADLDAESIRDLELVLTFGCCHCNAVIFLFSARCGGARAYFSQTAAGNWGCWVLVRLLRFEARYGWGSFGKADGAGHYFFGSQAML